LDQKLLGVVKAKQIMTFCYHNQTSVSVTVISKHVVLPVQQKHKDWCWTTSWPLYVLRKRRELSRERHHWLSSPFWYVCACVFHKAQS